MAKESESEGRSSPFNVTSLIALLTLLGGLLLVSNRLVSDRPVGTAETQPVRLEDQSVEARLWEDPFKWKRDEAQTNGTEALSLLREQIEARSKPGGLPPHIMAVMVMGGKYSEDHEARIRSRYAIVSALGESGYVPESSEHLGAVMIPWPVAADLRSNWLQQGTDFTLSNQSNPGVTNHLHSSGELPLTFEWYRKRDFSAGSATSSAANHVLTVWLAEERFGDHPEVLLALLLKELCPNSPTNQEISVIGPRTSTTLRAMLPPYDPGTNVFAIGTNVTQATRDVLQKVDLYAATPSAMDEALVRTNSMRNPRYPVELELTNRWFKSFHNFNTTDAQLAREAIEELRLRNVDLRLTNQHHLALISEADTFYARMLSLTYAAELAHFQNADRFPNRLSFVDQIRTNGNSVWPSNLRSFVYPRGIDGQTAMPNAEARGGEREGQKPKTLEELKSWKPDQNKAVGESQFDYLARLGEQIEADDRELRRTGRGSIGAIGIIGSDVYDTELILQALNHRFGGALFFTTDLDARLWHPDEQTWTRNLLVLSPYGLQLNSRFQGQVAPFRDSAQTAQFAAALAALGNAELRAVTKIVPRRFEIGRGLAYDLSPADSPLHPPAPVHQGRFLATKRYARGAVMVLVFGGLLATLFWRPFSRLTWDAAAREMESLWFREEDVGSKDGAKVLIEMLKESQDPITRLLWTNLDPQLSKGRKDDTSRMQILLDFLNLHALQCSFPEQAVRESDLVGPATQKSYLQMLLENQVRRGFIARNSQRQLMGNRQLLDDLLGQLPAQSKTVTPNPVLMGPGPSPTPLRQAA